MDSNLKLLVYILLGIFLMWLGYSLYFRFFHKKSLRKRNASVDADTGFELPDSALDSGNVQRNGAAQGTKPSSKKIKEKESSGGLMICPICLFRMDNGEMIKTTAFPPLTKDGKDRLMHIHGCVYCMGGKRERICPVCGKTLSVTDFLIARIFDRSVRRSHVHVLGCTQCRPLKTM